MINFKIIVSGASILIACSAYGGSSLGTQSGQPQKNTMKPETAYFLQLQKQGQEASNKISQNLDKIQKMAQQYMKTRQEEKEQEKAVQLLQTQLQSLQMQQGNVGNILSTTKKSKRDPRILIKEEYIENSEKIVKEEYIGKKEYIENSEKNNQKIRERSRSRSKDRIKEEEEY